MVGIDDSCANHHFQAYKVLSENFVEGSAQNTDESVVGLCEKSKQTPYKCLFRTLPETKFSERTQALKENIMSDSDANDIDTPTPLSGSQQSLSMIKNDSYLSADDDHCHTLLDDMMCVSTLNAGASIPMVENEKNGCESMWRISSNPPMPAGLERGFRAGTKLSININNDNVSNRNPSIQFLMIQRKFSLGFVEFIRGKYKEDIDSVIILIKQMIKTERDLIISNINNFENLWQKLWRNSADKLIYTNEYKISKEKFDKLCSNNNYIKQIMDTTLIYSDLEWGFPKGRKKKYEKNISCAIREFEEETNLKKCDYKILKINPYEEIFYGTNSVKYKHVYYLAILTTDKSFRDKNFNDFQLDEIADINLFDYNDTINNIRPYYVERIKILNDINNFITNQKLAKLQNTITN